MNPMSDVVNHECGVVLIRLLKPFQFYRDKYGSARYGLHKLYLTMEKMVNRGQDGAGIATVKLEMPPGVGYIDRQRSVRTKATLDIFNQVHDNFHFAKKNSPELYNDVEWQKQNIPFLGELLLGHLRYGTFGKNNIEHCHPFFRLNNWKTRNLAMAGNFNLTNVDELFEQLVELGQHPREKSDTITVMEKVGHFLEEENDRLFRHYKSLGHSNYEISSMIANNFDLSSVLIESSKKWDGGYVLAGMIGHGDAFVLRDPNGIRPAFFYHDDEVAVVCSERPVIQTVFDVPIEEIQEVHPGCAIIIKQNGEIREQKIKEPGIKTACSFERIYFSRGNDSDIYKERKELGQQIVPSVLKELNFDLNDTVFSYIPHTAEVAFSGMMDGIDVHLNKMKAEKILSKKKISDAELNEILNASPRLEKIVLKDAKQRTFITDDASRDDLVSLVYDITYGIVRKGKDTLVVMDDSIVRGTTLKQSVLNILNRLEPKKIIIVSSAPQIRYPDCYGIDMAILGKFIAFEAAIAILKERGMEDLIQDVYEKAREQLKLPKEKQINVVKEIYKPFSADEISCKITELLKPPHLGAELQIIYQSIEGLRLACPHHTGDWYFTGNYPTPGGNRVANKAYLHFMEGKLIRAY